MLVDTSSKFSVSLAFIKLFFIYTENFALYTLESELTESASP